MTDSKLDDTRTWKDIGHVQLNRMENVESAEDRSIDAKSYIEASGLETALKEELGKVLSMPMDSRPKAHKLVEVIGKAFLTRSRTDRRNFVRRASNMSIGFPVSFPNSDDDDDDEEED